MKLSFDGKVANGKLILYDQELFTEHYKQFEGKGIRLTLEQGNKRSNAQNSYWHGVVVEMFREAMGHEKTVKDHDYVHDVLRAKINSEVVEVINKLTGESDMLTISRSTANLSTIEFMALVERAQKLGAEFYGIVIPDPNQTEFL